MGVASPYANDAIHAESCDEHQLRVFKLPEVSHRVQRRGPPAARGKLGLPRVSRGVQRREPPAARTAPWYRCKRMFLPK